jgi:hypothetical protein
LGKVVFLRRLCVSATLHCPNGKQRLKLKTNASHS